MLTLKIEKRDPSQKLEELRGAEKIPAVFYGKGVESTPVSLLYSEFKSVWKEVGTSALIGLSGVGENKEVLIHDIDVDPITSQVKHIDFYVIERGKLMEATVPLEFIGESPAVKSLGGILVKVMRELKVEVLPKDLPQHINVDISSLSELESQIAIKDLKLPIGVRPLDEEEEVVASISQASEEEPEESTPADISEVEIEKKGKKEEEEPAE
ncbi:50S ribosomal protein L25 [Patescibacteria group bacterium]|nr:50S ribosomal protein L25 [Patescibacteria group bacterium]